MKLASSCTSSFSTVWTSSHYFSLCINVFIPRQLRDFFLEMKVIITTFPSAHPLSKLKAVLWMMIIKMDRCSIVQIFLSRKLHALAHTFHANVHRDIHACAHTHAHTHTDTDTHTDTHTQAHTHTHTQRTAGKDRFLRYDLKGWNGVTAAWHVYRLSGLPLYPTSSSNLRYTQPPHNSKQCKTKFHYDFTWRKDP